MNELRTPMQPLGMQNIDLNDSVVINEDRTVEDYHTTLTKNSRLLCLIGRKHGNIYSKTWH